MFIPNKTIAKLRKKRKIYTYEEVIELLGYYGGKLNAEPADLEFGTAASVRAFIDENLWVDRYEKGEDVDFQYGAMARKALKENPLYR